MRRSVVILLGVACAALSVACSPDEVRSAPAQNVPPTFVVLTPTANPSISQFFSWRTAHGERGLRVELTAAGEEQIVAKARREPATTTHLSGSSRPQWTAKARGLTPATTYRYRIVTTEGFKKGSFSTAASAVTEPWTFLAFGDTQNDNAKQPEDIIDLAVAQHPSARLMLQAGDSVNLPWVKQEWVDLFKAMAPTRLNRSWIISIGNHEQCVLVANCRSGDAQAFKSYFRWPSGQFPKQDPTWFYVDYQGVRFVILDSMGPHLKRQARFLDQALAENPMTWSVVLEHAAPFASRGDRTNQRSVDLLLPIFEKRNVDLVLSGHDHSYARGYRGDPDSTVYATSVSGPKFYSRSDSDWKARGATRVRSARSVATFQAVTVGPNSLTYRAVIGYKGTNPSSSKPVGAVLDHVTITKSDGTKTVTGKGM